MPNLNTAQGLVLHTVRHGETSLILTVFCRETGKIGFMAKGARSKSRLGSSAALEILSEAQFVYYNKQGRDLQLLKEWTILNAHRGLREDFNALTVGSAVSELLSKCLREHDVHTELYEAAVSVLETLDQKPCSPLPILWLFQISQFRALGYDLALSVCAETGAALAPPFRKPIRFRLADGAFFAAGAGSIITDGELSVEAFAVLSALSTATPRYAARLTVSPRAQQEIMRFMTRYLETHMPVSGKIRSLQALNWGRSTQDNSTQT